ncbi:LysR family transcriptional regulator [Comamonas endophytica]|uniref:LysR family transcriptional regulator n=1 Tax=Comamonas endophytica TaxID=2949090 RepID=A0ABY6GF93_9BURK|nr:MULTISPECIES: LysR family transcriptional regulator [unclassified Acidovorax]MCD2514277.1 LysR family transcriptional regulator [Acidovorax sp. D4N7]UYG53528.1 LysR family transcriptional regulator [Acidovorax sp. 5MLIR]
MPTLFDTRTMRYLLAVADLGSMTAAAAHLEVAQPALSQALRRVEQTLGVRLFERSRRGSVLSSAGQAVIEDVRASLALAEGAERKARAIAGGKSGRLHIGFVTHAVYDVLPQALKLLHAQFPGTQVVLSEMGNADLVQALSEGRIDLAMLHTPVALQGRVRQKLVRRDPLVAVLPASHPLEADGHAALADLERLGLVWFPEAQLPALRAGIASAFARSGLALRVVQETNRSLTVLSCVAAGVGASLLPQSAEVLHHRGVRFAPLRDGEWLPHFELSVLWQAQGKATLASQLAELL